MKAVLNVSMSLTYRYFILLLLLLILSIDSHTQIIINEVCPRNATTIVDEFGEYEDWIELYNSGPGPVNLNNWSLSDDPDNPYKWIFPEVTISPDSFYILMASGISRKAIVDHWETIIHAEDIWKYSAQMENPYPQWMQLGFDDSDWLEGPGGFGRGDDDDNTVIADTIPTVYIRKEFEIQDTSIIDYVVLHVDFDDAFVAYLNGVEIARENIGWAGKIEDWNNFGWDIHEAQMYQGGLPEEFIIDTDLFKSLAIEGENVLAIQGLNAWGNYGNSSLIPFLSVGIDDDSFTYQPVPEWFEQKKVWIHTNFSLSADGETIILSKPDGSLSDLIEFPYLMADHSFGRENDGMGDNKYFGSPSPLYSNENSQSYSGYTKQPDINMEGGFYNESLQILFSNYQSGDTIRFTRDGSVPVDTSEFFSEFVIIDTSTVVKARVFKNGYLPGEVEANSYFMNYESQLPVFSISIDPYDLWDWEEGVYVMGPNAEPGFPHFGANFWQDWEKPIHIEYYDTTQQLAFEQDCGLKIHGGWSRAYDMKSLRILANGKYGKSEFDYQFFEDKDISQFKRFILRNSGQDYGNTHFRDAFISKLFQKDTPINMQDYQPSVVFLNGQYWGIHNIREKIDRFYLRDNYNVNPDSVHLLRDNINFVEGNYYDYAEMIAFIKGLPVIDSLAVDSISRLIDLKNFTDYFCAEMFVVNPDWPNNNIKYWKSYSDTAHWRYIMTDTDFGFGLFSSSSSNELHRLLHGTINFTDNHRIFRRLIENQEYRRYFINRSADIFNTVLVPDNVIEKIYEFKDRIKDEIPLHQAKWGGVYSIWESNVNDMIYFANHRPDFVWQDYIQEFNLEKLVNINLDIDSVYHGNLKINSIIPDSLPWQGTYFDGNPIDLIAIADSGYIFSHWLSNPVLSGADTLINKLRINVDTNVVFKAFFIPDTIVPLIVFSEINYNSVDTLDAGDWVEIRNIDSIGYNISNWVFKDGVDDHEFFIPDPTILDVGEILVLCRDVEMFSSIYPDINNCTGPFEFGLSSQSEQLRLYKPSGLMVLDMEYSSDLPWPDANGTGFTLELKDSTENLSNPENWFLGCIGGSPGTAFMECDTVGILTYNTNNNNIGLYPNPATNEVRIEVNNQNDKNILIQIINDKGISLINHREQLLVSGRNIYTVSLSGIPKGVYFVSLTSDHIKVVKKLIVQ